MFVVLDTNHFSELVNESPAKERLIKRLSSTGANAFTTIITCQEVCQGWCALINRLQVGKGQVPAYREFQHSIDLLNELVVLPFDDEAAKEFRKLQAARVRVGTMDLKIASICIAHDALLLTRNLVDFEKVPRLKVENWVD